MRRVLRAAILLGIAAAVLVLAMLILLPFAVERMQDDLVRRVATAIGEDVEIDSLEMRSMAPWLRLSGLRVGSPTLLRAGDASLRIDVGRSLSSGRLVGTLELHDFEIDLTRPSSRQEEDSQPSDDGSVPLPIVLSVEMRGGRISLPEERRVAVERLDGEIALDTSDHAELDAEAAGLELRWRDRITVADRVRVAASWSGELLSTEMLQASGPALTIEAKPGDGVDGSPARGIGPTRIQLEGQLRELIEFAAASEVDVGGRAAIDLQIQGSFTDPLVRAAVTVDEPSFDRARFEKLAAQVTRKGGVWTTDDVEVTWPAGRLVGALRLAESPPRLEGRVGWLDVDLDVLLNLNGDEVVANRTTTGDAELAIDLDDLNIRVEARGHVEGDEKSIPVSATVTSDGEGVAGSAEIAVDPDNHMTIRIARADAEELSGTAAIRVASIEKVLQAFSYRGPLPARGGFAANATVSGILDSPVAAIEVTSSGLRLADGTPAELQSQFRISTREAKVDALSLRAGGGELVARGDVALSSGPGNEWDVRLAAVPLHPILESLRRSFGWSVGGISGVVDGRVSVRGPWKELEAAAQLGVDDARVDTIRLGKVNVAADAQGGSWRIDATVSDELRTRAVATVAGRGGGVREIAATIDDWPVEELLDYRDDGVAGRLSGEVRLVAGGRNADGTLRLALRELNIGDIDLGNSEISGVGNGGAWRIDGTLLDGAVNLDADLQAGGGFPFEARLDWRQESLPALEVAGEKISVSSRGLLTVEGRLASLAEANAQLEVEDLKIASGGEVLSSDGGLRARFASGALQIDAAKLRGSATQLRLDGGIGISRSERLVIDGVVDLESVAPLVPAVEEAKGTLELRLEVQTGEGPVAIDGNATLRDVAVEVSGAPPATKVVGEIRFSGGRAQIKSLEGEIGDGKFSIGGDVGIDSGPDLRWEFVEVGIEPIRDLEMIVSGEGTLAGAWDAPPLLAGAITIDNLLYDRNLQYQDLIPSFDRAMAPPQRIASDRPPLRLDLRVRARDGLYVENNIAKLEARTDLRIRGTPRKPSLRGTIEVIDGSISLRGRYFDIENGVLTFRRDLPGEAQIDFAAESLIEADDVPYRVTVRVTGTTDDYRVHLGSEEGLSQTDIAALIAFGKTVAQVRDGGESDPTIDRLAGLAGGRVGGFLAGEAREVLPFDEIEIRPGYSPSTGQFEPQLRVGKTITADLSAWLGQSFGVQPQTLVEATYALTHQISMVLRWESQTQSQEGAFGGEVSQRFEFWHFPDWLTWGAGDERPGDE